MRMQFVAALVAVAALQVACSNPQGPGGSTASSGVSASSGDSAGSGDSGSGDSGSGGSSASNGSSGGCLPLGAPDNGDASSCCSGVDENGQCAKVAASSGSSGEQATCIGGPSCTYDNDCGGSATCLYHDNEPGCCVATNYTCQNGSAVFGPCAPGWVATADQSCCVPDGGAGDTGGSGGTTGACVFDGGVSGGVCSPDCQHGFHCENGECVLNGGNGPIQVTLQYGNYDDLDLHVVQPDGCEVYYGNTQCGGASLDLDSNAACGQSTVDAENVIYDPTVTPESGTYVVRVDFWENCDNASSVPFLVKIRHNGITDTYCDGFDGTPGHPYPGDQGGAGSGRTITSFTYP